MISSDHKSVYRKVSACTTQVSWSFMELRKSHYSWSFMELRKSHYSRIEGATINPAFYFRLLYLLRIHAKAFQLTLHSQEIGINSLQLNTNQTWLISTKKRWNDQISSTLPPMSSTTGPRLNHRYLPCTGCLKTSLNTES